MRSFFITGSAKCGGVDCNYTNVRAVQFSMTEYSESHDLINSGQTNETNLIFRSRQSGYCGTIGCNYQLTLVDAILKTMRSYSKSAVNVPRMQLNFSQERERGSL